ncbi:hypothetical protein HY251_11550 [bacterium]|nr:hypothetical protein [bacterium]
MSGKTVCALSRAEFLAAAATVVIQIDGVSLAAAPREFSTGSFGWYVIGKATLPVNGKAVAVQASVNITVVGSKETPRNGAEVARPPSASVSHEASSLEPQGSASPMTRSGL